VSEDYFQSQKFILHGGAPECFISGQTTCSFFSGIRRVSGSGNCSCL
jgi:hypothetical protein